MTATNDVTVHVLRPAPPVRAFLIAALATVVGAAVLVTALSQGWPGAVVAVAAVVVVFGLALLGVAIASMARMRVRAELTPSGYAFRTPAGVRHGTWGETTRVSASESGHRLTFVHRDETVDHVLTPLGNDDPAMAELVADITRRLDASRGR